MPKIQHPGITLLEQYLMPAGISQNRLANQLKVPPRRINEIVLGKRGITADTAVRLAIFFKNMPEYWLALQNAYDIAIAKRKLGATLNGLGAQLHAEATQVIQEPEDATEQNKTTSIKRRMMR